MRQPPEPVPRRGDRPTLLIVEDDPVQVGFYQAVLGGTEASVRYAGTLAEADAALADGGVAAVVLDLVLPDGDGRSWLARLRERSAVATIPVIVVAGSAGLEAQVDCYGLGASLLIKPVEPRVLSAAVAGALEQARRDAPEQRIDEQTGLANRAGLLDAYDRARAAGPGPIAVALLETDRRPRVGGLAAGLRRLAAMAIDAGAEPPGTRWSQTVVAALFLGSTAAEAGARLETARARARTARGAAASIGVAEAAEGVSLANVAAEADRELTAAKLAGGDRVAWPGADGDAQRTVLVAEDDDVVGALLEHRLQRDGFVVERARDGLEALELANKRPIELAILDVLMPGMDGFELLARLRAMPQYARIPIVMLTGLSGERDVERALRLGANDYVVKPFSPVELAARINRLLRQA